MDKHFHECSLSNRRSSLALIAILYIERISASSGRTSLSLRIYQARNDTENYYEIYLRTNWWFDFDFGGRVQGVAGFYGFELIKYNII